MSKLNISRLTNENEDGAPKISGISTFSSTAFFEPPKGTTAQRPEFVQPGMIRFNTDGAHLEYYNGVEWTEVLVANNTLDGGNRGLFMGGGPSVTNTVDYITISTLGNAADYGDLTQARWTGASAASSTRAITAGGETASIVNTIQYVTIASTGNSVDFGDLIEIKDAGGEGICSSSTRGIFGGGNIGPAKVNTIEYITITTLGNATDFGDLTLARGTVGTLSNSTRGLFAGGEPNTNIIDFITIASIGNAQDFGDLLTAGYSRAGVSSPTRGCFGGGATPTLTNVIEYVEILSAGNSQDFGDLTRTNRGMTSCSNGHGGL